MRRGPIELVVLAWSAWAPTLETYESWKLWARGGGGLPQIDGSSPVRPPIAFLPPLQRRRCSDVTRAALSVAYACVPPDRMPNLPSVFASRHGEADISATILESIVKVEPVSPADFSLSVHNAASGLFSINAKNVAASSALASREALLNAALLEGLSQAREAGSDEFLCVLHDAPSVSYFGDLRETYTDFFGFSLRLAIVGASCAAPSTLPRLTIEPTRTEARRDHEHADEIREVSPSAMLRWWISGETGEKFPAGKEWRSAFAITKGEGWGDSESIEELYRRPGEIFACE